MLTWNDARPAILKDGLFWGEKRPKMKKKKTKKKKQTNKILIPKR